MTEKKTVFLNYVSEKLIHVNTTNAGRQFASVTFPCAQSATGFASVGVNLGQLLPATKKDNTVSEGYKNVLLGKPDAERQVSICTKAADGKNKAVYEKITMTNQAIADAVTEDRAAYRKAQAVATA